MPQDAVSRHHQSAAKRRSHTQPARDAFLATFADEDARRAHFTELGRRSGEARRRPEVDRHIAAIVEAAPKLSREQLDRLTAALRIPNQTQTQAG